MGLPGGTERDVYTLERYTVRATRSLCAGYEHVSSLFLHVKSAEFEEIWVVLYNGAPGGFCVSAGTNDREQNIGRSRRWQGVIVTGSLGIGTKDQGDMSAGLYHVTESNFKDQVETVTSIAL